MLIKIFAEVEFSEVTAVNLAARSLDLGRVKLRFAAHQHVADTAAELISSIDGVLKVGAVYIPDLIEQRK